MGLLGAIKEILILRRLRSSRLEGRGFRCRASTARLI